MQKYRLHLMIAACIALVALVWLDNRPESPAPAEPVPAAGATAEPQGESAAAAAAEPDSAASGGLTIGNPLASISKDQLRDTVERPLLAPGRRRPPAAQAAGNMNTAAGEGSPAYELLGVLRNGDRAIALLRKAGDGTSFRVETGDMIGGWRVAKVEPASVLLERGDGASLALPLGR